MTTIKTFNDCRKEYRRTGNLDQLVMNCLRVVETNQESVDAIIKEINKRERKEKGIICGALTSPQYFEFSLTNYNDDGAIYTCEIRELIWIVELVGNIDGEIARKAMYRCLYKGMFYGLELAYETHIMSFEKGREFGGTR